MLVILVLNVYNVYYSTIYGCERSYVALTTQRAWMFQPTRYYFLSWIFHWNRESTCCFNVTQKIVNNVYKCKLLKQYSAVPSVNM